MLTQNYREQVSQRTKDRINDSCFQFVIYHSSLSSVGQDQVLLNTRHSFSDWVVACSSKTAFQQTSHSGRSVGIIGFCIDSHGELSKDQISGFLLDRGQDVHGILAASRRFAGKYVLLYFTEGVMYIFPDATSSLPINYYSNPDASGDLSKCLVSSLPKIIANVNSCSVIVQNMQCILDSRSENRVLPGDVTVYEHIYELLANHYLVLPSSSCCRFYPKTGSKEAVSTADVIQKTIDLTSCILDQYHKYYQLVLALTGGWDSRLVLATFVHSKTSFDSFTYYMKNFSEATGDLVIPQQLAREKGFNHTVVHVPEADQSNYDYLDEIIGNGLYSQTSLRQGCVFQSELGEQAFLTGDIVGPIAKSSLSQNVPDFFACPSYFRCKLHCFHPFAKKAIRPWYQSIQKVRKEVSPFDLFTWENRITRWVNVINQPYSCLGVTSLNSFNCRELLEAWVQIPRRLRYKKCIHLGVFEKLAPDLMQLSVNPGSDISSFMKKRWPLFLFGTYFKFYRDMIYKRIGY